MRSVEVALVDLLCEQCRRQGLGLTETYTPYLKYDIELPKEGADEIAKVHVEVHAIKWQKLPTGCYGAEAILSLHCVNCEGIHSLTHHLEAPKVLIKNIGKCGECRSEFSVENEVLEYSAVADAAPVLTIQANLVCHKCSSSQSGQGTIPFAEETLAKGESFEVRIEESTKRDAPLSGLARLESIKTSQGLNEEIRARYEELPYLDDAARRGKALEELLSMLIRSIDGFIEFDHNIRTASEEIDIVFRNESRDVFWQRQGDVILVECKNWRSKSVGKNEFVLFQAKMKNRGGLCKLGFLVCTGQFANTIVKEMLRKHDGLLVVPIDGKTLHSLVYSDNRGELLKKLTIEASML